MLCSSPLSPSPISASRSYSCIPKIPSIQRVAAIQSSVSYQHRNLLIPKFQLQQGLNVLENDVADFFHRCNKVTSRDEGDNVYSCIIEAGHGCNLFLNNILIDMYSKCGNLRDACIIFVKMSTWNVFSWTAIITAHVKHNKTRTAISLFRDMVGQNIQPDKVLYIVILKACMSEFATEEAWWVYAQIIEYGLDSDPHVGSSLIMMHSKLGSLVSAENAFDKIKEPNVVVWNSLIMEYAQQGFNTNALKLYTKMQGVCAQNTVTILGALKACINLKDLKEGTIVHAHAVENGLELELFVSSSIVDMYVKCGDIHDACICFNRMKERNVVGWTSIIAGYVREGYWNEAVSLFQQMQWEDSVLPNELTYASVLAACSGLMLVNYGREIHSDVIRNGIDGDEFITNSLIEMYIRNGHVEDAHAIFNKLLHKDVVIWNSMISGHSEQGLFEETYNFFNKMLEQGLEPDDVTFISLLKNSSEVKDLERGKRYHSQIIGRGIMSNVFIASCLIAMYAKCNRLMDAQEIFDSIHTPDLALWNALISGYASQGPYEVALKMFEKMQMNGFIPDNVTYVAVLSSCANTSALAEGHYAHACMMKIGLDPNPCMESALLDMYAKCGNLEDAEYVFEHMHEHDSVSWTAMITAYAHLGYGNRAIALFEKMKQSGLQPNEVAFLGVLNACSHAGLVHEGLKYFRSMRNVDGVTPTVNHFACLVDLLSRAGYLEEAMDLINQMPMNPNEDIWLALLGACRNCNNIVLARMAMEKILELDPENSYALVLVSNIPAAETVSSTGLM